LRKVVWNARVFAFHYYFVKTLHIVGSKWRHKRTHLIQNTAQTPYITFLVMRHVFPYFGRRIVRRSSLRIRESLFLDYFADIKVSKFRLHIFKQENICRLHVTMQNFATMERLESSDDLYEDVPDFLLFDVCFSLLVRAYLLEHVAIVRQLHDQAHARASLIYEGLFESNNVWVVNRRQNPDFIERICSFFFA
jgi:hypothetical protein